MNFWAAVEGKIESVARKIKAGLAVDGYAKGPVHICEQAAEEPVDVAGWLRGLDQYPMTGEQQGLIDVIVSDAELLYEAIERLKATYGES